jgi:hypothetical protein
MRQSLRDAGSKLQVLDQDATLGDLQKLAARTGHGAQLRSALSKEKKGG